jgi:hypothetical protein
MLACLEDVIICTIRGIVFGIWPENLVVSTYGSEDWLICAEALSSSSLLLLHY